MARRIARCAACAAKHKKCVHTGNGSSSSLAAAIDPEWEDDPAVDDAGGNAQEDIPASSPPPTTPPSNRLLSTPADHTVESAIPSPDISAMPPSRRRAGRPYTGVQRLQSTVLRSPTTHRFLAPPPIRRPVGRPPKVTGAESGAPAKREPGRPPNRDKGTGQANSQGTKSGVPPQQRQPARGGVASAPGAVGLQVPQPASRDSIPTPPPARRRSSRGFAAASFTAGDPVSLPLLDSPVSAPGAAMPPPPRRPSRGITPTAQQHPIHSITITAPPPPPQALVLAGRRPRGRPARIPGDDRAACPNSQLAPPASPDSTWIPAPRRSPRTGPAGGSSSLPQSATDSAAPPRPKATSLVQCQKPTGVRKKPPPKRLFGGTLRNGLSVNIPVWMQERLKTLPPLFGPGSRSAIVAEEGGGELGRASAGPGEVVVGVGLDMQGPVAAGPVLSGGRRMAGGQHAGGPILAISQELEDGPPVPEGSRQLADPGDVRVGATAVQDGEIEVIDLTLVSDSSDNQDLDEEENQLVDGEVAPVQDELDTRGKPIASLGPAAASGNLSAEDSESESDQREALFAERAAEPESGQHAGIAISAPMDADAGEQEIGLEDSIGRSLAQDSPEPESTADPGNAIGLSGTTSAPADVNEGNEPRTSTPCRQSQGPALASSPTETCKSTPGSSSVSPTRQLFPIHSRPPSPPANSPTPTLDQRALFSTCSPPGRAKDQSGQGGKEAKRAETNSPGERKRRKMTRSGRWKGKGKGKGKGKLVVFNLISDDEEKMAPQDSQEPQEQDDGDEGRRPSSRGRSWVDWGKVDGYGAENSGLEEARYGSQPQYEPQPNTMLEVRDSGLVEHADDADALETVVAPTIAFPAPPPRVASRSSSSVTPTPSTALSPPAEDPSTSPSPPPQIHLPPVHHWDTTPPSLNLAVALPTVVLPTAPAGSPTPSLLDEPAVVAEQPPTPGAESSLFGTVSRWRDPERAQHGRFSGGNPFTPLSMAKRRF